MALWLIDIILQCSDSKKKVKSFRMNLAIEYRVRILPIKSKQGMINRQWKLRSSQEMNHVFLVLFDVYILAVFLSHKQWYIVRTSGL